MPTPASELRYTALISAELLYGRKESGTVSSRYVYFSVLSNEKCCFVAQVEPASSVK